MKRGLWERYSQIVKGERSYREIVWMVGALRQSHNHLLKGMGFEAKKKYSRIVKVVLPNTRVKVTVGKGREALRYLNCHIKTLL